METRSSMAGIEVPIIGSDSLKWLNVSVISTTPHPSRPPFAPPTEDAASCSVIGSPPAYLIWRIHKSQPQVLEILELYGHKEFPRNGLRIEFSEALSPFALIYKNEADHAGNPYMLYALTVSGIVYLIKLKNIHNYVSSYVFPPNEILEFDLQAYPHYGAITSVAAVKDSLVIGASNGSVGCFHLGILGPSAPGFLNELRDDVGFGRLWGLMSRSRTVAAVQDLAISELHGKKLLFVLHTDGFLRVWDLSTCTKIFGEAINIQTLAEATFLRLWVGEANTDTRIVPVALHYRHTLQAGMEMIHIYSFRFSLGDRNNLLVEPSVQNISFEEGRVIDVKLTSTKIWILKEDGLIVHDLLGPDGDGGIVHCYALQEAFVADQLFQSSEHSSDDLLWVSHSIFSSSKDQIAPIVSSIFLRRLLLPGVHHNNVLRSTLQEYNKHLSDSEFYSLSVDGLKGEILSLIEQEGISVSPVSVLYCWKIFCARYFDHWCKSSAPCGLLIDSSAGSVGLIRKNSISLFRGLEDIESLLFGSFDEVDDIINPALELSDDLERELLFEVLRCINSVNQQLGKASSAVYYESLLSPPNISSEEVVPRLVKILETGYSSSITALHLSELGVDTIWEKEVSDCKNLRKFSANMFLSLHALCSKATSWGKVLDVIESYLKFLVPQKIVQKLDSEAVSNIGSFITVQATTQVAKVMFESALDVLLLLSYMLNISGQILLSHTDVSRIQLEFIPMIQEVVTEWHIIHFFGTTPSESPSMEDFSSQLSSLQIDSNMNKASWNEKLGRCNFTLGFILVLNFQNFSEDQTRHSFRHLPDPSSLVSSVRDFTSWLIWGKTGEESSSFFAHLTDLCVILLHHGQYDAVEYLLGMVDTHLRKEKISESVQSTDGQWCKLLHLLGCCLLAQAHCGLHGLLKEKKVSEAVRCFFRVASGQGAPQALQNLPHEARLPPLVFNSMSGAAWKLQYYQWVMQSFEQYNMSEGACQFALAALEQVDEALVPTNNSSEPNPLSESATTMKGRLWANVFKFTLDLNYFYDAYCAIISNPDEESKYICLRRFIFVLYERGAAKILCDGRLPFTGLADKVEQELAWKAERSDIYAKPNSYKLLYAFEMNRQNWRKAANYIYRYSAQLRTEEAFKDHQRRSLILHERLNGISAAINALHLVHPAYAWIDFIDEGNSLQKESYPSKRARITAQEQSEDNRETKSLQTFVDVEKLENEYVLTSAEYFLSLENVKWSYTANEKPHRDVVGLLVHSNLYDMAFTVLLRFWKGSALKRELEQVFVAMSEKCCPSRIGPAVGTQGLLLTSSKDEMVVHGSVEMGPSQQQYKGNSSWETLELYLEKYKVFHPRLPVIVAETLLHSDSQIELPLWLVHMFKGVRKESSWGMGGSESNPASLLQLYVDYGRYAEATNLVLEYIESFGSVRPADVVRRKRTSAVWFPYTTIERLWCQLEESIRSNRMIDQCEKLKKLLHGALLSHLNLLKVDSEDVMSSAAAQQRSDEN